MFCIKKLFILFHFAYFFSFLGMEKITTTINIFYLPFDMFTYILDFCIKPEKKFTQNISHLALDYMFYQRIAPSNKVEWTEGKNLFLKEYLKIGYIKNLYALYLTLRLVSHEMALKINRYFAQIRDRQFTRSFLSVKTNIYLLYLSDALSYLNYQIHYNQYSASDRSRILYLMSVGSKTTDSNFSISINVDTNKLYINANIHGYYIWSTMKKFFFICNKIRYPNKKVVIQFPIPIQFFDEETCLSESFYREFFTPQSACYIKRCVDLLVIKDTYFYHQNPQCVVNTTYENIKKLTDIDLRFSISYNLNENIHLEKKCFLNMY